MNDMTAYLLAGFKLIDGKPQFQGVGIFSERNPATAPDAIVLAAHS